PGLLPLVEVPLAVLTKRRYCHIANLLRRPPGFQQPVERVVAVRLGAGLLRLDSPPAEGDISVELPLLVDRIPDDPRHLGPIHVRESLLNDPSNQRRVRPVVAPLAELDHVARQRLSLTEPVGLLLLPLGPSLRRGWPRSRTLDHAALLARHRVEEHQAITKLRSAKLPLSFKPLDLLASLRIEKDRVRPVSDHQRRSRLQV